MRLSADTPNGHYSITDNFEVRDQVDFDIRRSAPTRIYPRAVYPVDLDVTVNKDYKGYVEETVPVSFEITRVSGQEADDFLGLGEIDIIESYDAVTSQSFKKIRWYVDWKAGETHRLSYIFDAPNHSPDFYLLGPLWLDGKYQEIRQWQLAGDAANDLILLWDSETYGTTLPAGWTSQSEDTPGTYYNKMIRGANSAGGTGGADNHTHTVTTTVSTAPATAKKGNSTADITDEHTHTYTTGVDGSGTTNNLPAYRELVVMRYTGTPTSIPNNAIALFDATPVSGTWSRYSAQDGKYIYGTDKDDTTMSTGGNTSNQHSHQVTVDLDPSSGASQKRGNNGGTTCAQSGHDHTVSDQTTNTATYEPPYRDTLLYRNSSGGDQSIPVGMIGMFDAAAPTNWDSLSGTSGAYENKFIKPAATYGGTSGGGTHGQNDITGVVSGSESLPMSDCNEGSGVNAVETHTHTVDLTSFETKTEADMLPTYVDVVVAKYNPPTIDITGSCKQYNQSTNCADSQEVKVAYGSSLQAAAPTTLSGAFTFSSIIAPAAGQIVTVFLNGVADSNEAVAVTEYDGTGNITGLKLFEEHLTIGSEDDAFTLTNAELGSYDNDRDNDTIEDEEDIFFEVDTNADLVVDATAQSTQETLHIQGTNTTYRPDSGSSGNITTHDIEINAILTADGNTINVAGSWDNNDDFNSDTSTVIFNGSGAETLDSTTATDHDFYDLQTSGTVTLTLNSDTDVTNDVSIGAGTTLAMNDKTLNVDGGNVTTTTTGSITCSGCTAGGIDLSGDGTTNGLGGGSGSITLFNLTLDGATNTTNLGTSVTAMDDVTVGADRTLGLGTNDLTVGNSAVADSGGIANLGTITQSASGTTTVQSSDAATTATIGGTGSTTFYNLNIGPATEDELTYTIGTANNITVSGVLTIQDADASGGDDTHTFDANDDIIALSGTGTPFVVDSDTVFDEDTSTVKYEGDGATNVTAETYYHLHVGNDAGLSQANTYTAASGTITVTQDMYVGADFGSYTHVFNANTNNTTVDVNDMLNIQPKGSYVAASASYPLTVAGNFINSGSFTHSSGQVTLDGANGTTQTISGATSFYNLSATTTGNRVLEFTHTTTYTVTNDLTLTGTDCDNLLILRSTTGGTQWTLDDDLGGTTTVSYVDVQDSNASDQAVSASNSSDSGNNTNWTIAASACEGASTNTTATGYSFQRKTFLDSTNSRHWLFYHDGDEIEYKYSSDNGSNWTAGGNLSYDTNDFSVWQAKISTTEYVWLAVDTGDDIVLRRGTLGASSITWDSASPVVTAFDGSGASDTYAHAYVSLDSSNYIWTGARYYDGSNYNYYAVKSANTADTTWTAAAFTFGDASQLTDDQADSNVYGNIVPLGSQDMYATFVSDTALEGCVWDHSDTAWEDSAGGICTPVVGSGGGEDTEEFNSGATRSTSGPVFFNDTLDMTHSKTSSRQLVSTSTGKLYAVIEDNNQATVWYSADGASWAEKDASNAPALANNGDLAVAIDSNDILHIVYEGSSNIDYITFDTADGGSQDDAFNSSSTVTSASVDGMVVQLDVNDEPHVISQGGGFLYYTNKIAGSWKGTMVTVDSGANNTYYSPDLVIDENNIPQISYAWYDSVGLTDAIAGAIGNQNDASSFTTYDIDTSTDYSMGSAIVVDEQGNTYIGYTDVTTQYITLAIHTVDTQWDSGGSWTTTTNSDVGVEISMSTVGKKTIILGYEADGDDAVIQLYDGNWGTEIIVDNSVQCKDIKLRYSNYGQYDPWIVDVMYVVSNADLKWDVVDLRPNKIDDASDLDIADSAKSIVRTSSGNYYAFVDDGPLEVWKSSDGYVWEQQDSGTSVPTNNFYSVAIDSNDVIHVITQFGLANVRYYKFLTDTDAWDTTLASGTYEDIRSSLSVSYTTRIAVDSNNVPHVVYLIDDGTYYAEYNNRVGGTWESAANAPDINSGATDGLDIIINQSNVPEIIFSDSTQTLTTLLGNDNDPIGDGTPFYSYDIDTSVSSISAQILNMQIDSLTGNTWVTYQDSDNSIALAKYTGNHTSGQWTSTYWSTILTKTDVGYDPELAIAGSSDIYVIYRNDDTDIKVVYDVYDSNAASPSWAGEEILQSFSGVDLQKVNVQSASPSNNYSPNRLPYMFDDGTDVYWDYLYLRREPTNIDDASDFGAISNSGRAVLRTSDGILYSVLQDGTDIEVWRSLDEGGSWSEQDAASKPTDGDSPSKMAAGIDSSGIIHVAYGDSQAPNDVRYVTFSTANNSWSTPEDIYTASTTQANSVALTIDDNDIPHVAFHDNSATESIRYYNRLGGSWGYTAVENVAANYIDITINEDNSPEVSYLDSSLNDLKAAQGDANDPTTFSVYTVDNDVVDTSEWQQTSIGVDTTGDTWIAFKDNNGSDDYITLAWEDSSLAGYDDWTINVTNSNTGFEPSLSIDGSSIYVMYRDDQNDVVYDMYNGSTWSGETVLEEHGVLQDVKVKWSYINDYDSTGTADVQTNTYYFDDSTPSDPDSAWIGDASAFDGVITVGARTSTNGTETTNELSGQGTSYVSGQSGTITSVKARVHSTSSNNDEEGTVKIYDSTGTETLATISLTPPTAGEWTSLTTLSTPTSGWDWTEVDTLNTTMYRTAGSSDLYVDSVEILVESTNSTSPNEIDYVYSDGSDVFYNRLALGSSSSPGTQDAIDTVPNGLTDTLSAVADTTNYDVHLAFVDDDTTDQISYRRWDNGTTTWQAATLVPDAASDNDTYPTISIDTNSRDLTLFWIDTSTGAVFYNECDVSGAGSECSTAGDWDSETSWKSGTNTHITSSYGETNEVFAQWTEGTTLVTVEWDRIAAIVSVSFTQNAYRWYVDDDTANPSDPWSANAGINLAENTAITVVPAKYDPPNSTQELRLRVNMTVNNASLTETSKYFKLQYKAATDGLCTGGAWTDVDSAATFEHATSGVSDDSAITGSLGDTDVSQTYSKSKGTSANPNTATQGQQIEYDFHIVGTNSATTTQYSFRTVETTSDGSGETVLDAYTNCALLTTEPDTSDLMRHGGILNEASTTDGLFWAD
ncbi:hypothetical protein ACFL2C_03215 [Patescibacteria group bacterium]